jgi:hypothetical protein
MSDRLRRQDGILVQEAHGQTVLLRVADGSYYALDEVGAAIWELCDGAMTAEEVADAICEEFDGPPEQISADVHDFVAELLSERLLDRVA